MSRHQCGICDDTGSEYTCPQKPSNDGALASRKNGSLNRRRDSRAPWLQKSDRKTGATDRTSDFFFSFHQIWRAEARRCLVSSRVLPWHRCRGPRNAPLESSKPHSNELPENELPSIHIYLGGLCDTAGGACQTSLCPVAVDQGRE